MFQKIWKTIEHNRYVAMFAVVYLVLLGWVIGCSPHTRSIVDGRAVDAVTFEQEASDLGSRLQADIAAVNAEIESYTAKVEIGRDDLQRQAERRKLIVETLGAAIRDVASGSVDPLNAMLSLLMLGGAGLGLSAAGDNRRKDKRIETLKTEKTEADS